VSVDLEHKAKWHVDLNGGLIPVLEFPDGTLIYESNVIIDYAHEQGGSNGLEIFSKDPIKAAI